MGLELEYIEGQTPLEQVEIDGLRIPIISTRGELDEFEQQKAGDTRKAYLRAVKAADIWRRYFTARLCSLLKYIFNTFL